MKRSALAGQCREAAIVCITKLLVLIRSQSGPAYKVKVYKRLIADWYAAAGQQLPLVLETADGLTIQLTQDFVLLCQLFGGEPAELLAFYPGRVGLTGDHCRKSWLQRPGFWCMHVVRNRIQCSYINLAVVRADE